MEEVGSEDGRELRNEGDEQGRAGNIMGGTMSRALASIQYTTHTTPHNAVLAFRRLY